MIFWRYEALAKELFHRHLSPQTYRAYLILFILSLPYLLVMSWGVPLLWAAAAYIINGQGDGKDFNRRFISLYTPILLRALSYMIICSLPVALLFALSDMFLQDGSGKHIAGMTIAIIGVWFLVLYPFIPYARAIKIASGQNEPSLD